MLTHICIFALTCQICRRFVRKHLNFAGSNKVVYHFCILHFPTLFIQTLSKSDAQHWPHRIRQRSRLCFLFPIHSGLFGSHKFIGLKPITHHSPVLVLFFFKFDLSFIQIEKTLTTTFFYTKRNQLAFQFG